MPVSRPVWESECWCRRWCEDWKSPASAQAWVPASASVGSCRRWREDSGWSAWGSVSRPVSERACWEQQSWCEVSNWLVSAQDSTGMETMSSGCPRRAAIAATRGSGDSCSKSGALPSAKHRMPACEIGFGEANAALRSHGNWVRQELPPRESRGVGKTCEGSGRGVGGQCCWNRLPT